MLQEVVSSYCQYHVPPPGKVQQATERILLEPDVRVGRTGAANLVPVLWAQKVAALENSVMGTIALPEAPSSVRLGVSSPLFVG